MTNKLMTMPHDARALYDAALAAADSYAAVERTVRLANGALRVGPYELRLPTNGRIVVVGAGKASARMAQAAEAALGERIAGGVIAVKDGHAVPTRRVDVRESGHPLPMRAVWPMAAPFSIASAGWSETTSCSACCRAAGRRSWNRSARGLRSTICAP